MQSTARALLCLIAFGAALTGCNQSETKTVATGPASTKPTDRGAAQPSMPMAPKPTEADAKKERAKLDADKKRYEDAKQAYEKDANGADAKSKLVKATIEYGTTVMMSSLLAPKEKYPQALRLYREALKLDPKNEEAQSDKDLIEGIYRQMGRPIPEN